MAIQMGKNLASSGIHCIKISFCFAKKDIRIVVYSFC